MIEIADWYQRLGNNIQQCGNALLEAMYLGGTVAIPRHSLIEPFSVCFGSGHVVKKGRYFYWRNPFLRGLVDTDVPNHQLRGEEARRRWCFGQDDCGKL